MKIVTQGRVIMTVLSGESNLKQIAEIQFSHYKPSYYFEVIRCQVYQLTMCKIVTGGQVVRAGVSVT